MWQDINWRDWRLLIKLDPDKRINARLLEQIVFQPVVDGVIVGGTQNITKGNTEDLVNIIRDTGYSRPLVQEISQMEAISTDVDGYLLPVVLNTANRDWFIGKHLEAVKKFVHLIDWSQILPEAYVICNPQCAAAQLTQTISPSFADLEAYFTLVEKYTACLCFTWSIAEFMKWEWLKGKERRLKTHIFYGGWIKNLTQAVEMMDIADTIVLGKVVYENPNGLVQILKNLK